jgi:hypothetical protein
MPSGGAPVRGIQSPHAIPGPHTTPAMHGPPEERRSLWFQGYSWVQRVPDAWGGGAPQVKAAAQARLRAMVDPALGVLEYAMKRKHKDLRGALQAAKEALDRAKPEGEGDGLEAPRGQEGPPMGRRGPKRLQESPGAR